MDNNRTHILFASDFHLGIDTTHTSKEREIRIVRWLESYEHVLAELYLVGDIFDYWYEYKTSIPKGFSDLLAMLKRLRNKGVRIFFFTGNHDMWMFNYFTQEYGIKVYREPQIVYIGRHTMYIGHGDGLGPGDFSYKVIKQLFASKIAQWLFSLIHPTLALGLMKRISQRDAQKYTRPDEFKAEEEWLIKYAQDFLKTDQSIDYFIFGHRHLMYEYSLSETSKIINLGDWITQDSYAVWDGNQLQLRQYED